ncbi:phosphatidylinositol phosphate synthase [Nocardioides sp. zg-1228]|uniref:phosphatidylinositol phosphate synthase n=1 Tax=Nocardioides sp. zg-1228 TaxID=2763008 RepID=UPI0016425F6E|nr:CDP-alcohol phosphatidyltransferase family protein [Nocardioides sp. zg-1228]MBC2933608.1 CDP-alcohol phosphatidyltransferase family protein [Nocardioides sp. zg-1228]QSF56265.1 CDP-alcohol phosphatidyltransferase family protein [Nocardioides sp. zg-1228]
MLEHIRGLVTAIISPIARLLLRLGVSPDAVTLVGTVATCTAALWFAPRGELVVAALVVTVFALFDLLDGTMARMSERASAFGAFLDSTLDRIADAVVFGAVILYFAGPGDSMFGAAMALFCLVTGVSTSYARARAESLGFTARVGIMERADRLVVLGIAAIAAELSDQPLVLAWGLALLGALSSVTVAQRIWVVRRQALDRAASQA